MNARSRTGQPVSCQHLTILSPIKIPSNLIMPLLVLTSVCLLQWHLHIFSSRSPLFPCVLTFNRYQTSVPLVSWRSALRPRLAWLLLNTVLLLFCHQGIFWSCRQSIFEEMQKRFSQVVVCVLHVCVCLQHGDSFDTNPQMKTSGKKISWFEGKLRAIHCSRQMGNWACIVNNKIKEIPIKMKLVLFV